MHQEIPKSGFEIFKDIVSIIGTLLTAAGAIVAVVIGYRGLNMWRVQMKDTTDRELARRILISLYKVKNLVGYVRRPFREYSIPEEERGDKDADHRAYAKQYQMDFNKLSEERIELQVAATEAQAIWDRDFLKYFIPLNVHLRELEMHIAEYLESRRTPYRDPLFDHKETRKVIFGGMSKDEFGKKLDEIILDIDKIVRVKFE